MQSPVEARSTRDLPLSTEAAVWRFHGCKSCRPWSVYRVDGNIQNTWRGKQCFFFCRLHLTDWISALIDCMCWRPSQVAVVRSNRLLMPVPRPVYVLCFKNALNAASVLQGGPGVRQGLLLFVVHRLYLAAQPHAIQNDEWTK
jgi:hypothetical protein